MDLQTQILKKGYKIDYKNIIKIALDEDIPQHDLTSKLLISPQSQSSAKITAKQDGIVCGIEVVKACYNYTDKNIKFKIFKKDGDSVKKGEVILELQGKTKTILEVERTALNFLQHLSGISTLTSKMVKIAKKNKVTLLDTRKTAPGLRILEKYAVVTGGGKNHRLNLSDEVLIKENHIMANQGIENTIIKFKKLYKKNFEIEVETIEEFLIALKYKVPFIMLDNFSLSDLKKAVKINKNQAILEASGGVNLKTLKKIVKTGIQLVSVGSITHSAPALDFSLSIIQ